ncbi:MAG: hypothetical protein AAF125_18900, partial [Chloroflexota bacterium]
SGDLVMETVEITLKLPKSYIDEAADFGLLDTDEMAQVLMEELDRRVMAFVDAEVKAHRAEQNHAEDA